MRAEIGRNRRLAEARRATSTTPSVLHPFQPPQSVDALPEPSRPLVLVYPRNSPLVTRHSSLVTEILIANPRLEFPLTPFKTSELQISNRQYPAIFSSASSRHTRIEAIAPSLASSLQPLASGLHRLAFSLQKLIVTPELEFRATRTKQNSSSFSNRYKMRFLHPPWRARFLRAPWRAPLLRPVSFSYNPGSHPPEVNQL